VCAHVTGAAGGQDITGLRVLLTADLLARIAELRNLQVLTVVASAAQPSGQVTALERAADALRIHPPAARARPHDAQTVLAGPIDVHLASYAASVDSTGTGLVARVGGARIREAGTRYQAESLDLHAGYGPDPLAIRLALMMFPYHQPADLTGDLLASARETLEDWRHLVAGWAELPSGPMPARIVEAARAAFGDLDTVRVLALLRGLAPDGEVPTGARLETFLYFDRTLGLDLAHGIGQPRN